jgi:hypothetical protein
MEHHLQRLCLRRPDIGYTVKAILRLHYPAMQVTLAPLCLIECKESIAESAMEF